MMIHLEIKDGGLHLALLPDGRDSLEYMACNSARVAEKAERFIEWRHDPEYILARLLEDHTAYEVLSSRSEDYARIGALTDAPIIATGVERDDHSGALVNLERAFWFPRYAVEDPLQTLLETGKVIFEEG